MKKPMKFFRVLLVACALFGAQAIAWGSGPVADQSSSERSNRFKAELEFLHEGSAKYLTIDQSLGVALLPAVVNGQETLALLDTGASGTSLDLSLAQSLGLAFEKSGTEADTAFGTIQNYVVYGVEIEVPTQFKFSSPTGGKDLAPLSRAVGKSIGLVVGMDVLRSIAFLIDSPGSRIVFSKSGSINPRGVQKATRFTLEGDTVVGTISGKKAIFEVDLGTNSEILVLDDSWQRLFGDEAGTVVRESFDAAGRKKASRGLNSVDVTIGPVAAKADVERIALRSDGIDALIGYPLFKDRVTIFDYSAGHFTILAP